MTKSNQDSTNQKDNRYYQLRYRYRIKLLAVTADNLLPSTTVASSLIDVVRYFVDVVPIIMRWKMLGKIIESLGAHLLDFKHITSFKQMEFRTGRQLLRRLRTVSKGMAALLYSGTMLCRECCESRVTSGFLLSHTRSRLPGDYRRA